MAIQGVDKAPPTKTKEWAGIHMRIKMIMSRVKKECSGSEGDENQQRNKQKQKAKDEVRLASPAKQYIPLCEIIAKGSFLIGR